MLFNTIDFAIFLPIVFIIYWFVFNKNFKYQNLFLVFASYIFYGWWDWKFLSLILFSTVLDYFIGKKLSTEQNLFKRKILLWMSIVINLSFLGFFKYYNFFLENFIATFTFFGSKIQPNTLNIILPVGISFYTFQTLSYSIDVYKKKLQPTKNFISFAAFVSFFPQLVAGPIERASNLLPQFSKKRKFDTNEAIIGINQIVWGLFKKIVIADNCAQYANDIFLNYSEYSSPTLILGVVYFSFQIYGDFSGYSDIAIGTSRLFGFDLKQNFAFPYFSRDIAEFWRRWHISLSSWFKDYLYIPLGGSRGSLWIKVRNTFIIFLVSGFWHGANWTFIIWGGLNALYFLPLLLSNRNRSHQDTVAAGSVVPKLKELVSMSVTFGLVVIAWVFFRADNVSHAVSYIGTIFSKSLLTVPAFTGRGDAPLVLFLILVFMTIEWFGREGKYGLEKIGLNWKRFYRYLLYVSIIVCLFLFSGEHQEFIYFQF